MEVHVFENTDKLIQALANTIQRASKLAISQRGQFNFVLSGGGSPKQLYKLLASEPYKTAMDWKRTYFFFGDERFVPEGDSQRNSLMAAEALFEPLSISDSQIYKVDTSLPPKKAAQNYLEQIQNHFNNNKIHFDFILLGLGDNAHTASLFPHTEVLNEERATVSAEYIEEVNMNRITMTAPLINQARTVAFLVFGSDKAEAVAKIMDASKDFKKYPGKLIHPESDDLQWFLDKDAGHLI